MLRRITGFTQDGADQWVAGLSCLHGQHVRHRPPFQERAWVLDTSLRQERVGTEIDCPLCDRAEPPAGLHLVRTAGPFDATTLPPGLRSTHRVAAATWGVLRVLKGEVGFWMATEPPMERTLRAGEVQPIPPGVPHRLLLSGDVQLAVDFLVRRPEADAPAT